MTIVEFFDKEAIENIVSSLLCNPDKVVFLGHNADAMAKAIKKFNKIMLNRGKKIDFSAITVAEDDLQGIAAALEKTLQNHHEITIDLTGGDDLYLVAAGKIQNDNPERVQLHRFNAENGKFTDCDADGNVWASTLKKLTIEEIISIYGGCVVYKGEKLVTQRWDFTEDFIRDINTMWNICYRDVTEWNTTMTRFLGENDTVKKPSLYLETARNSFLRQPKVIEELSQKGLICNEQFKDGAISFKCKNEQIKKCLMKAGQLLELKVTATLLSMGKEEKLTYPENVLTGAVLSWENAGENKTNVINEIDVIATKGLFPVFISCKNGIVEVDELYKLETVTKRFGGDYAKAVLVATKNIGKIKIRAKEMGIKVIDDIGEYPFKDSELKQNLEKIIMEWTDSE